MLGLDAEVAKLQAKVGARSKAVKRRRQKQPSASIFELSKANRSGNLSSSEQPSAPRSKLEAKAALYDRLASGVGSAPGSADEDVMVDFLAKRNGAAEQPTSAIDPDHVASGSGGVVLTDEFGRQRTVAEGSREHKQARRKQREANALGTKLAQRQAAVQKQYSAGAWSDAEYGMDQ